MEKGFILWFTGLSGAGKTTISKMVYNILRKRGYKTELLDGDIVRESLTKDLGFSREDIKENIQRIGFVADLLNKNNVKVISAFISPYEEDRKLLKNSTTNFIEVFVNPPLSVCEKRDVKGLYKKARKGELKNFAGIHKPYEKPKCPDIILDTSKEKKIDSLSKVMNYLEKNKYI